MTLFYISAVLSLLLAGFVLTLKQSRAAHVCFAGALIVMAALNGLTAGFEPDGPATVSLLKVFLAATLPVLLFLHIKALTRSSAAFRRLDGVHALGPLAILLVSEVPGAGLQAFRDILLFGLWGAYALLAVREAVLVGQAGERKPAMRLWVWLLSVWMAGVAVIDLALALLADPASSREFRLLFLVAGGLLLATVATMLFAVLHRSDLLGWITDRPPKRVARSENLIEVLERGMRQSRAFLDPNLTLARFARQMSQPQRAVADEINDRRGRNFRAWLNGFRIEEARRLMQDDPLRSITEVFLDAGFQAKSTFNAAFKAETGLSPSAWRATLTKSDG
ncbi:helix-turn-helix domain-containing protein [Labrenzia sp. VG12]|uniref:AraC family transcriptional regulator n=1 Tax=Labrenzia sp. VG12 TaxID=2021862 RepID=UPI000B8BD5D1|nr:helix-turn-helix domain-containing protein [Labrenzia sp. VG12]ASP34932.1 hypothetical protein CHH27_18200 [Labrenzia sp. VG12]